MAKATVIAYWPGKEVPACPEHLSKLVGLAAILGFRLSWSSCDDEQVECSNCESEAKKTERSA
jgi:hypothetical protein